MSLLSLIVKIGADASGFNKGLKDVERESDSFAGRFAAKFTKVFVGGLVINAVRGLISDTLAAGREIEKTQAELANSNAQLTKSSANDLRDNTAIIDSFWTRAKGLKTELGSWVVGGISGWMQTMSYAISIAKDAVSFGEPGAWLNADIEDNAKIMAQAMSGAAEESEKGRAAFIEKRTKERAELQKKIDDAAEDAYKSKLTNEEKLLELVRARKILQDAIASGQIPNTGKRMEAQLDVLQMTREINQLELGAAKKSSGKTSKAYGFDYSPPTDELSRIGIFNRSSDYALTSIGNRIVSAVEMTAENTKTLAEGL